MNNILFTVAKIVAVIDGFILAVQLLPYGGYDGAPGVPNIDGWQAVLVALFIISAAYLLLKQKLEIDNLKIELAYHTSETLD
jgi:hypothetical protein